MNERVIQKNHPFMQAHRNTQNSENRFDQLKELKMCYLIPLAFFI